MKQVKEVYIYHYVILLFYIIFLLLGLYLDCISQESLDEVAKEVKPLLIEAGFPDTAYHGELFPGNYVALFAQCPAISEGRT